MVPCTSSVSPSGLLKDSLDGGTSVSEQGEGMTGKTVQIWKQRAFQNHELMPESSGPSAPHPRSEAEAGTQRTACVS